MTRWRRHISVTCWDAPGEDTRPSRSSKILSDDVEIPVFGAQGPERDRKGVTQAEVAVESGEPAVTVEELAI